MVCGKIATGENLESLCAQSQLLEGAFIVSSGHERNADVEDHMLTYLESGTHSFGRLAAIGARNTSLGAKPQTLNQVHERTAHAVAEGVLVRFPAFISRSNLCAEHVRAHSRELFPAKRNERISVTRSDCPSAAATIMQPRASPVAVSTAASQKAVTALRMSGSV